MPQHFLRLSWGLEVVVVHISKIFLQSHLCPWWWIFWGKRRRARGALSKFQEFKPASDPKSSQLLDSCYFRWLNTNRCKLTPLQFGFATACKEMTGSQLGKLAFVTCWSWLCHRHVKKPEKTSALSPSGLEHLETNAEAKWIQPDTTHTEDCLVKQNLCLQDLTLAEG